jgi:hypothetical protein
VAQAAQTQDKPPSSAVARASAAGSRSALTHQHGAASSPPPDAIAHPLARWQSGQTLPLTIGSAKALIGRRCSG